MNIYTVWVGGTEVIDNYVTLTEARELVEYYKALGYDDVIAQSVSIPYR